MDENVWDARKSSNGRGGNAMKKMHAGSAAFFVRKGLESLPKGLLLLLLIASFTTGCKKPPPTPPPPPDEPVYDEHGTRIAHIDVAYRRPGTPIKINLMKGVGSGAEPVPEAGFSDADKALIFKALDMLTDEELLNTGIYLLYPQVNPRSTLPSVYRPGIGGGHTEDNTIIFTFKENKSVRLLDPELGNLLLAALGFPDRKVSLSNLSAPLQDNAEKPGAVLDRLAPLLPRKPSGLPLGSPKAMVISPEPPTAYVSLLSPEGLRALSAERQLAARGRPQDLTLEDQIRPHGEWGVTAPTTPNH